MRPPQELLYESESTLRLVDKAIEDLRDENAGALDQLAACLRDDLTALTSHLQRTDATSEQLADIATMLADMRARLADASASVAPELNAHVRDQR